MPSSYDCEVCGVSYVEVRATFIEKSGTDTSVTVGVARENGEITQVCMAKARLDCERIIFDEWGYGQIEPLHQLNHIVPSANPVATAHWCARFINVWRLPPYVWRDDMDSDQPIIVTVGRWLGTRGTAEHSPNGDGWTIRLNVSGSSALHAQRRGTFGWTFREDDKNDYGSVLPRHLRYPPGTLVWAAERPGYTPVMGYVVAHPTLGPKPNCYVQQLNSDDHFDMDEIHREVTPEERAEYLAVVLGDD